MYETPHLSGRPTESGRQLLDPAQTAAMLDVKRQTLALWRTTKRYPLPYIKVGRSVKYRLADVEAFLEGRTVTPPSIEEVSE
jgi:hypothetical protein